MTMWLSFFYLLIISLTLHFPLLAFTGQGPSPSPYTYQCKQCNTFSDAPIADA